MSYLRPALDNIFQKDTTMRRIFTIIAEPAESQVTLSEPLVRHMMRHNRHGRESLRVVPIQRDGLYGLDVNPPYSVLSREVQETMSEVQWNDKTATSGLQLEDPTIIGVLTRYGMEWDEHRPLTLRVEARRTRGRWIYWILPDHDDVDQWYRWDCWQRCTERLQRWRLI